MKKEIWNEFEKQNWERIYKKGIQKEIWDQQPAIITALRFFWFFGWLLGLIFLVDGLNTEDNTRIGVNIFNFIFYSIVILAAFRKKNRNWFRLYYHSKVKL